MTALPDRAAPCRAAKRPKDVLLLCAALALCGEAIEPRLDIGNPKVIKPEPTDARLDVVLHMALVCRARERGQIRSNGVLMPPRRSSGRTRLPCRCAGLHRRPCLV